MKVKLAPVCIGESLRPPCRTARRKSAARNAAPPALGYAVWGSPPFADSEPRRGAFGPLGALGPPPPRAGFGAPS
eukprot:4502964-Alexandrium_andersonii.AAC.1